MIANLHKIVLSSNPRNILILYHPKPSKISLILSNLPTAYLIQFQSSYLLYHNLNIKVYSPEYLKQFRTLKIFRKISASGWNDDAGVEDGSEKHRARRSRSKLHACLHRLPGPLTYHSSGFVLALLITGLGFVRHVKTSRNAFRAPWWKGRKETERFRSDCLAHVTRRDTRTLALSRGPTQPRGTRNRQLPEKHFLNELRARTSSSSAPATYPP